MPDFYSIKGGGEFYDMSPHGLCVHRDFDFKYIEVKVLKVKFRNLGENGASVFFAWNINNGRFTPIPEDRLPDYTNGSYTPDFRNDFLFEDIPEQQTQMPTMNYNSGFDYNNFEEEEFTPF